MIWEIVGTEISALFHNSYPLNVSVHHWDLSDLQNCEKRLLRTNRTTGDGQTAAIVSKWSPSRRFDFAQGEMNECTQIPSRKIQTLRPERNTTLPIRPPRASLVVYFLMLFHCKHYLSILQTTSQSLVASVSITIGATSVSNFPAV